MPSAEADAWDEGFRAGQKYEWELTEWWDAYDDDAPEDENEPRPYLPGNPYRPLEIEEPQEASQR